MHRSLRTWPAGILATLLLLCSIGLSRDAGSTAAAWSALASISAEPALHASTSAPRVDVRQLRRVPAVVALPSETVESPHAILALVGQASHRTVGFRAERAAAARGYDATAPPQS